MLRNIVILFLVFLSSNGFGHGGHKAYFTLEKTQKGSELIVRMEEQDIRQELEKHELLQDNLELSIVDYLSSRLKITFDSEVTKYQFTSSYTSKGYIYLKFDLNKELDKVNKLKVFNSCFKDFEHLYYNIVRLNFGGIDVTYRMTDSRTEIEHQLN